MSWLAGARTRLRLLFSRAATEERLAEEFRFHVEMQTEQNIRDGMEPREARRQAMIVFGGVERHKETMREQRGIRWLEELAQDIRFGVRGLVKSAGFTLVAAITIALGVGATTAVFSLLNALLLRPLDVPSPERLFVLTEARSGAFAQGLEGTRLPYVRYAAYREATGDVFAGLAATQVASFSMRIGDTAIPARGALASGNYFDVLGIRPAMGRFFSADDDPAVVLAHGVWRSRFGGDPAIIGRPVHLDGRAFTVVGVAPAGFGGITPGLETDLWVPLAAAREGDALASMSSWVAIFGRLQAGTSVAEAAALVDVVAKRIPPDEPQTRVRGAEIEPMHGILRAGLRDAATIGLTLLLGTALLVLLIASANIAGMLLARGLSRRREMAIRLAMGAERGRIVRQLLTESGLLALLGGAGGVLLAVLGRGLAAAVPVPFTRSVTLDLHLDVRVLAFALAISLGTALLFGLVPALQTSRPALLPALKEGGSAASVTSTRGRSLFVAGQLGIAVFLLMVAALFVRSLQHAVDVDLGYDADGVVIATTNLGPHGYDQDRGRAFYDELVERVRAIPGVERVSLAQAALAGGSPGGNDMQSVGDGQEVRRQWGVAQSLVDSTFFATVRLPVVAGRGFTASDREGAPEVTVVNETLAFQLWPEENPIGRMVSTFGGEFEVVGVVRDGRYSFRNGLPSGYAFFPHAQRYSNRMTLHARGSGEPSDLVRHIRREVRSIDPNIAVEGAGPLSEAVNLMLAPQRAVTTLLTLFGLIGVVLAGIGVYGVMAFQVAQRRRELGVRLALGAPTGAVVWQVVGRGAVLAMVGIATGLLLGLGTSSVLRRFLYGASPFDPAIFAGVAIVLASVALLASFLPVRRVMRLDPVEVLRAE